MKLFKIAAIINNNPVRISNLDRVTFVKNKLLICLFVALKNIKNRFL
jgi:hypothetical protein